MKSIFHCVLTCILTLVPAFVFGQIEFQHGYFITDDNEKTECLIRNVDWKNNPTTFDYRLDSDEIKTGSIEDVKEFGINEIARYVRANVKIDRSGTQIKKLSITRKPDWAYETLFLKVLVEGKYTLYSYEETNFSRFFYSVEGNSAKQLVYKRYTNNTNALLENNTYWNQLFTDVNCGGITEKEIKQLKYKDNLLKKYFDDANACSGSEYLTYGGTVKRQVFHLKLTAGVNMSSVKTSPANLVYVGLTPYVVDEFNFTSSPSLTFGIEAEFMMPFNGNKWSVLVNPTYQSLKAETTEENIGVSTINYSSVELALGLRHYFYLNKSTALFANIHLIPRTLIYFDSDFSYSDKSHDLKSNNSFSLGGGILKNSISLEIRYYLKREVLNEKSFWSSSENRMTINFGYRF